MPKLVPVVTDRVDASTVVVVVVAHPTPNSPGGMVPCSYAIAGPRAIMLLPCGQIYMLYMCALTDCPVITSALQHCVTRSGLIWGLLP